MKISIGDKIVGLINRLNIVPTLYYIPNRSENIPGFISLSPNRNSNVNRVAIVNKNTHLILNVSYNVPMYYISFYTFDDPSVLPTTNRVNYSTRYLEIIYILGRIFDNSYYHCCFIRVSELSALEKTIDDIMGYDDEEFKLYISLL